MGLEAATYIDDLNTSNPIAGDNVSQGDDHIRLLKSSIKNSFPSVSRAIYLEHDSVDLASATTPDLSTPASNYVNITGTTQIDGFATEPAGFVRLVRFAGILTLNYNATSFILISGDDIVTAAGDHALFVSLGSGNWRMVEYHRASGQPLVPPVVPDATEVVEGIVEHATNAEIWGGSGTNKAIMSDDVTTANAYQAVADGAPIAIDWTAFYNGVVTLTASRQIGNPTNEIPGTHRKLLCKGNDGTDRTITFGAEFLGEVPVITDCDQDRWYMIYIECVDTGHFSASSRRVKG